MPRLCVFGDSITHAGGVPLGWVDQLKKPLGDNDWSLYNLGISGDNSSDLLERLEVELAAREPELSLVAIGTNDSQFNIESKKTRVPIEQFVENLSRIYDIVTNAGSKLAFVGLLPANDALLNPIPWDENKQKCYDTEHLERYDAVIRAYCDKNNLPYIDVSKDITIDDLDDGIHPNQSGYTKIAQAIEPQLFKLL